jgi:hypothetical protein
MRRSARLLAQWTAFTVFVGLSACPWTDYDFERTANAFAALFAPS